MLKTHTLRYTLWFATILAPPATALGADYTWTGSTSGAWNAATNWGLASGYPHTAQDTASFAGGGNSVVQLNSDPTIARITFSPTVAAAFTLTNGTLNLADGGVIVQATPDAEAGNVVQTIASPIKLQGSATLSGNSQVDGPSQSNALLLSGPITGEGTITIVGDGTRGNVRLSGDNRSFTGNLYLKSGTLVVESDVALGDRATVTLAGGQVWFGGEANTPVNFTVAKGGGTWNSYSANTQSGNVQVDLEATWNIGNGGGNALTLSGVIQGSGEINMLCGNTLLTGDRDNTFSGVLTLNSNSGTPLYNKLFLSKTGGATAIAGDIVLQQQGTLVWRGDDQISDTAALTLAGGELQPNGHRDALGTLTLAGEAVIDFEGGTAALRFAESHAMDWSAGKQLLIRNWQGTATHQLVFGSSGNALTAAQLAKIGFTNPVNQPPGLYRAELTATGEIVPTAQAVEPNNPPFDISSAAAEARQSLYEVPGRSQLCGASTPLKQNQRIAFFGDSITWLNGYLSEINTALADGEGTKPLGVRTFNHGINGGGAAQVLSGTPSAAFDGATNNAAQKSFAEVIAADQADLAVVFIGVNDVWWRNTSADDFRSQLEQIVEASHTANIPIVLVTLATVGEKPDGSNPLDQKLDQYAQITREVATAKRAILVDARAAFIAYAQTHNWQLQLDGSLVFRPHGMLTYDGVHPTPLGNTLLADLISAGIAQAAPRPPPN